MEKSEEGGIVMASSSRDIVIRVEHVNKLYGANRDEAARMMEAGASKDEVYKKTGCTVALWDVNLEIPRGEIFVIIGLSGSGKSTLVRCFNRLNKPTNGRILFDGRNLADMNQRELLQFRRNNISMVFQSFGLRSHRDVLGNVAYGLEVRGMSRAEREKKGHGDDFHGGTGRMGAPKLRAAVRRHAAAGRHCPRTGQRPGCAADG